MIKRVIFALFLLSAQNACGMQKYTVTVIGTGYVGLVLGACLSDIGHTVLCTDIDEQKIDSLKKGIIPIYEPGLAEIIQKNFNKNLFFSSSVAQEIQKADIVFIAVGTPMSQTGKADTSYLENTAKMIGENLEGYTVVCTKSTVPIGFNKKLSTLIKQYAKPDCTFDIVSNPEFLREGSAVYDSLNPDRIVIGSKSDRAKDIVTELFKPLKEKGAKFLYTDIVSAETIKYASNAFLATKISYINEMANLCDAVGANIKDVAQGMGLDARIGSAFLNPGPGFGGSCFPKDVQALLCTAQEQGVDLRVIKAAWYANEYQRTIVLNKIHGALGDDLTHKKIAILGLAFKANTDDIRESVSLKIIDTLHAKKMCISAYDPQAQNNAQKIMPFINYADSMYAAIQDADVIVILTEWQEFQSLDLKLVKQYAPCAVIIDTRNILDAKLLQENSIRYVQIGMKG